MARRVRGGTARANRLTRFGQSVLVALCITLPQLSFADQNPSESLSDVQKVRSWVLATNDSGGMPFVIVDKIGAQVLAFDGQGSPTGSAPALLGLATGDNSPIGIGALALAKISVHQRVTPAGRFVSVLGANLEGKEILWVDYDAALSMHPVIVGKVSDRRLQRLATITPLDNRISYGCINVPAAFFENVVRPLFGSHAGIVYILPETRSVEDVFFNAQSVQHRTIP